MSEKQPIAHAPETVLTKAQVADWLQISEDMVDRLNLRRIRISERKERYLAKHVLEDLEKRAAA
jgi:hypothetical protein